MEQASWKHSRWAVAVVVAGAGLFAFASGLHLLSRHAAQLTSNHLMTALPLAAGIVSAFVAGKRSGRERIAWVLLAAWGILSASGNATWEYYELFAHRSVPFPSLADAGYLGGNICAIAAIVMFAVVPQRAGRWRTALDACLIALSVFIVSWAIVLDDLFHGPGAAFAKAIGLAYPLIDVIIVSLIIFVWSRATARARGPLLLIGVGLIGWACADSSFAFLTLRNTYYAGHPVDAGWIGGDALIVVAAVLALRSTQPADVGNSAPARAFRLRIPFVVAGAGVIIGVTWQMMDKLDVELLPALVALLLLVLARQFLVLLEEKQITIDRLQSIDEMKNGILNAVSHELRTPLTYVKGTAYMLQDETLPAEIKNDLVGELVRSADRLEETLTGLLDLGRLSRGVLEPSRRPTDLSALLLGIAEQMRTHDHTIHVASTSLVANVDPVQVERIAENLFTNAVRHTPPGTIVVASVERNTDGVLIMVDDDGPGVPEEIREDIFNAFVQSDHTVQYGRGTGIGLSVVTKFAELHGGRAWVEASPAGGARFCVTLQDDGTKTAAA